MKKQSLRNMDMKELLDHRAEVQHTISELRDDLCSAEYQIIQVILKNGHTTFLKVNWTAVNRHNWSRRAD